MIQASRAKAAEGVERLSSGLERRLHFVSAEAMAIEQHEELRRQSLQLERFNTDFAVELATVLDQRLNATFSASLTQAVQPVVAAVESLSGNLGPQNQKALGDMVREFRHGLQQSTGRSCRISLPLGKVRESLESASAGMGQNGAAFGARIERAAETLEKQLREAVRTMTDSLAATASRLEALLHGAGAQVRRDSESAARALVGALSEASAAAGERITSAGDQIAAAVSQVGDGLAGTLEPILATLGGFRESLHALDGRFMAQSAQINDSVERMQGLAVQLERAATELRNAGTPIAGTAQRFETAGNRIDEAARSFGDTQRRLAEVSTLLQQSVAENNAVWEEYARRFEHADEQLGKVVKTLVEGADAYQQGIAKYVRQIDERLAHGVAQFGGAISDLAEVIEEFGTGMTPAVASELPRPAGTGRVTAGSRRT